MEKSCKAYAESTITNSSSTADSVNDREHYLKHLNKLSHKISKPSASASGIRNPQPPNSRQSSLHAQQHQPPAYNINKNEFRDVVQKLTGSTAHHRFPTPPPIHQSELQSSRLQRIRPTPLTQVSNRPPPMMNCAAPNMNPSGCSQSYPPAGGLTVNTVMNQRPLTTAPPSPLLPLPAVHAAAESSISAYMRYVQNSKPTAVAPNPNQFAWFPPLSPLVSPRWNNLTTPQPQHPQVSTTGMIQPYLPSSPLPFGCLNSPRSPYALLSPSLLFSTRGWII